MLTRREMLVTSGGVLLASAIPFARRNVLFGGWLDLPEARQRFISSRAKPFFSQYQSDIKGTGRNKRVLLWEAYEQVSGSKYSPYVQGKIGTCVGQATGLGCDVLSAVQIGLHGTNEEWHGQCSTEVIYAGSRIEIAKGAPCFDRRRRPADGSRAEWAGEYVQKYGVLPRGKYGNIDLTTYQPELARLWGSSTDFGVPDNLEAISKTHPVKTITVIEGWDEACDAVSNGYPVVVCCDKSFGYTGKGGEIIAARDSDGFLSPGRDKWFHCWLLWGVDTISKREGGCIANSWHPEWVSGPKHQLGTPPGGFWADAKIIDEMLKWQDSIALSNYVGYPRQHGLEYKLW